MLEQTRNAIAALKSAGLSRNEFRVRCPFDARVQGYGDLQINVFCPMRKIAALSPELAKHFKVVQYVDNGNVRYVSIEDGVPGIVTHDLSK